MRKEGKNWLFTTMVALLLLLSVVPSLNAVMPNNIIESGSGTMEGIEAKEGICGQKVWINTSGWNDDPREYIEIFFSNETTTTSPSNYGDYIKRARVDTDGELNVSINIPYRDTIGEYNVSMVNETGEWVNFTFYITDIYKVEVTPEIIYWDEGDPPLVSPVPQDFTVSVYNWTGSSYSLFKENIRYILWEPDMGATVVNNTMNIGEVSMDGIFDWSETSPLNTEANYTMQITEYNDASNVFADIWVPVRYHMYDVTPTSGVYNDEVTIIGYVKDGADIAVDRDNYIYFISPNGNEWYDPVSTSATGRFTMGVTLNESGTWYIGTLVTGATYRPTDEDTTKGITDFIWYETIEVGPAEGMIEVDPDETVYGFNITLDIYCEDDEEDFFNDAHVYVTGVKCEYPTGTEWDDDEYVFLGHSGDSTDGWLNLSLADEFKFTESGTATFLYTWPDTWDTYDADDDLEPDLYAETDVTVGTPGAMNVFIDYGGNDRVLLGDFNNDGTFSDPPESGTIDVEEWGNWSSYLNVTIYGKTDATMKNATITVIGCGLDLEYDEEDELYEVPGMYNFTISPRKGGILTIMVTNGSLSDSEDIEIEGLDADVTTSVGDDKEITVEQNESIFFTTDTHYAEVHANLYNTDWTHNRQLNWTVGDKTEGNGKDGIYEFIPDVEDMGYIIISAMEGYEDTRFYSYDVVEIVPHYDLVITIIEPEAANQTLTAGLEYDIIVELTNLTGYELDYADVDDLYAELLDWENEVIEDSEITFEHDEDNVWMVEDYMPCTNGTLLITVKAFEEKHEGNNSDIDVDWALFEYVPTGLTAGIDLEDVAVEVYGYDALGNIITEEAFEMWWNATVSVDDMMGSPFDDHQDQWSSNSTGSNDLDEDGMYTLWIDYVGNLTGTYYAKLNECNTTGKLKLWYPIFEITPSIIFVGIVNNVDVVAKDLDGNVLEGINFTFWPSISGALAAVPDPVETDENGWATLSLEPVATGTLNVSLARGIHYDDGQLDWDNLLTNSTVEVTTKKPLDITVSQSPVFEGDTLTITVKSEGEPVQGVSVQFGIETKTTDSDGEVTFTAPNPGVESATYNIKAEKTGYIDESIQITVIKIWQISILGPSEAPSPGEKFTITIIAKGSPLAGATITFDGKTYTSGGDGKATLTAPEVDEETDYTITATFDPYMDGTYTITIVSGGIPGFELVALIAAIGVALILFRRRR